MKRTDHTWTNTHMESQHGIRDAWRAFVGGLCPKWGKKLKKVSAFEMHDIFWAHYIYRMQTYTGMFTCKAPTMSGE